MDIKKIFFWKNTTPPKISIKKGSYVNSKCIFEGENSIAENSKISNCYLGKYTYIGNRCLFRDTKFGKYYSVGNDIKIVLGDHPTYFISTFPKIYEASPSFSHSDKKKYILNIENDVWIGDNALLFPNITIHTGAIIGAGALVNKDVPPYAVVAGVPARIIKFRFDEQTIKTLLKSKWWEHSLEDLKNFSNYFDNPEEFCQKFEIYNP